MGKEEKELIRAVIDTNVFVSSIIFEGIVNQLVKYWQEKRFIFLISKPILEEYIKVLSYPKFRLNEREIKEIIQNELLDFVEVVKMKSAVSIIKEDAPDNIFLSTAKDGNAKYIVSGDYHLLCLKKFGKIRIVKPKKFLDLLACRQTQVRIGS